ncbi:MAG: hypothetical protein DMF85_17035 [Acidobacteria bacterium]|nr:MAG: hypothetical protein DMF85_17035 [Acidobacteriota bacterium]
MAGADCYGEQVPGHGGPPDQFLGTRLGVAHDPDTSCVGPQILQLQQPLLNRRAARKGEPKGSRVMGLIPGKRHRDPSAAHGQDLQAGTRRRKPCREVGHL